MFIDNFSQFGRNIPLESNYYVKSFKLKFGIYPRTKRITPANDNPLNVSLMNYTH